MLPVGLCLLAFCLFQLKLSHKRVFFCIQTRDKLSIQVIKPYFLFLLHIVWKIRFNKEQAVDPYSKTCTFRSRYIQRQQHVCASSRDSLLAWHAAAGACVFFLLSSISSNTIFLYKQSSLHCSWNPMIVWTNWKEESIYQNQKLLNQPVLSTYLSLGKSKTLDRQTSDNLDIYKSLTSYGLLLQKAEDKKVFPSLPSFRQPWDRIHNIFKIYWTLCYFLRDVTVFFLALFSTNFFLASCHLSWTLRTVLKPNTYWKQD